MLVTVPCISRSCELVPDGFDRHLIQLAGPASACCLLCDEVERLLSCFLSLCRISERGRDDTSALPAPSWTFLSPCLAAKKGRGSLLHAPSLRVFEAPNSRIPFPTAHFTPFLTHTREYRGHSKLRTHTALGPYGRSVPRSMGPY